MTINLDQVDGFWYIRIQFLKPVQISCYEKWKTKLLRISIDRIVRYWVFSFPSKSWGQSDMVFSRKSNSTITNVCSSVHLFVHSSVCLSVCLQNPSTAWNRHHSSFIFHNFSFILHHSSFILHHHPFISRLLSFFLDVFRNCLILIHTELKRFFLIQGLSSSGPGPRSISNL